MWQTIIKIVDDNIHAEGVPYTELTPREQHTREAMFAVTVLAPLTGALLALFFAPAAHRPKYSLYFCPDTEAEMRHLHIHRVDAEREKLRNFVRYYKLVACWFTSIAVFGTVIYLQAGRTTRFTFVLAVFHNQIEVLIAGLLMGFARETCVAASLVYGLIMIPVVLFSTTMSIVFIGAAIVGGGIDMLIVLLLLYGKQYLLAAGAIGHVSSAVAVFTNVLDNFGVLPYNLCIFLGLWTHIGFTLVGILYAGSLHRVQHQLGNIDLNIEPASPTLAEDEHAPMPAIIPARRSPSPGRRKFVAHTTGNGHAPDPANAINGFLRRTPRNGRVSPSLSIDSRVSNSHEGSGSEKGESPTSPQSDSEFKHFSKLVRHEQYRAQCFAANPLRHVHVSLGPFIGMLVLSLVGSTFITLVLAFHAPSWGGSEWGRSQEHSWIWYLFDNDAKRGRGLGANPQVSLH